MAHVLIAPDKFKGSLTASQAADALADGIGKVRPDLELRRAPVADGGDGTVAAALAAGFTGIDLPVHGPTGRLVNATIAVRGDVAVVEAASACGLVLLPDGLAPMTATSYGVGELLLAALDAGCRTIVLGVGGTASTDGGVGMLAALGCEFRASSGKPIAAGGIGLTELASVDLTGLDSRFVELTMILASDVDNSLLGAADVFAPQKGATPDQVASLAAGLRRLADLINSDLADAPGAGAAGGIGYAALAVLGARRESGIELLLDLTGFADQLAGAALVITGEGSLDEQSLHGKAPIGVVAAANAAGIPAIAVAGRCQLDPQTLATAGIAACYALTDLEPDPARCIADAYGLLTQLGIRVARDWLAEVS